MRKNFSSGKAIALSIFLAATCALSGCASDKLVGRPDLTVLQNQPLPAPTRQDLILQQRAYVIGPYDKVSIDVFGASDLNRTVQVDANGQIALPLLGTVNAAGKSPTELANSIADAYRGRYIRDPQITVNVDTINQAYTVDGEVETPGNYPMTGHMTLIRAIASAKGMTQYAASNYVVVFRQVENRQMAALYDVRAIRQGIYEDPEIFANDIILVGESRGSRVFQQIIASGALLTAPLVAILQ